MNKLPKSIKIVLMSFLGTGAIVFINEIAFNNEFFHQKDSCMNQPLDESTWNSLKKITNEELKVCTDSTSGSLAFSYQVGSSNTIFISPKLLYMSQRNAILFHEAAHLKNNDSLFRKYLMALETLICLFTFLVLVYSSFSLKRKIISISVCLILGSITLAKTNQFIYLHQEYLADDVAKEFNEEKSLLKYFSKYQQENDKNQNIFFKQHPSMKSRIHNINHGSKRNEWFN